jgi:subtilase family serine protease
MSVSLIFLVCFIVASQSKILGSRSASNFPTDWEIVGEPCPYGSKVNFIVALKQVCLTLSFVCLNRQQNLDVLEETFYAVSDPDHEQYRNFLSIEEITKIVAPPEEDRKLVKKWLKANGVTEKIVDNGDSLEVTATVEVAERLFYTEFRTFRHKVHGMSFRFFYCINVFMYLS